MKRLHSTGSRLLVLRGGLGVLVGATVLAVPHLPISTLVTCFGIYATLDGMVLVAAAGWQREAAHLAAFLLQGLVGLTLGIASLLWTDMPSDSLASLMSGAALLSGLLVLAAALKVRGRVRGETWLALSGWLDVALGAWLSFTSRALPGELALWLGVYAVVPSVATILFALRRAPDRASARETLAPATSTP